MRVVRLVQTPSTQLAARAHPVGTAVVTDHQTAARGRLDRRWEARPGSALLVTVVLPVRELALFRAGVAAAEACGPEVRIKWPNDLLLDGHKLAGLLAERVGERILLGCGVNLRWAPVGAAKLDVGRDLLLDRLLRAVEVWWDAAPADVLDAWRARSATLGQGVRVELPDGSFEGVAEAIEADGALVVDGRRVVVGDVVHLRTAEA